MTLDTFFKKFDQFADAPDAVAKMRELMLKLAVQGKLVSQDSKDEPASMLLARIQEEKSRRKVRGGSTDDINRSTSNNDIFDIPKNWEWVGATTPAVMISDQGKKIQTKEILAEGDYPVVDQGKVFIRGYCNDSKRVIHVADPIIVFGDHTRETKLVDFDFVVGADGVKLLRPICINPHYYFLVLRWLPLESRGYARHFKLLKAARIPLPPLAEQKRIVAKVDELMALCDRLEARQQECDEQASALACASLARFAEAPTPANLNLLFHKSYSIPPADLRKAILNLAVQGKLVKSSGDTEIKPLGDILAEPSSNGISKGPTADTSATEVLRISAGTSRDDFYVDESDFKYVSLSPSEIKNATLRQGDLLACRYNGNLRFVGRFSLYLGASGRTQVNPDKLIRFRVDTARHDPRFVCFSMNAAVTRAGIEAMCATTAGNIGLSAGRIKTVPIALPPLAEQCLIVEKLDQLMALVDQLETQLADSCDTAKGLLEALVAELAT